jgi:hypothetical protein
VSDCEYRAAIACGPLLAPVLDRLLGALAARADLSVDRLSDLSLVSDALSATAGEAVADGHLSVTATPTDGALALTFGPFVPGGAARVRLASGLPGGGDLFAKIAREVSVVDDGDAERLTLRIGR